MVQVNYIMEWTLKMRAYHLMMTLKMLVSTIQVSINDEQVEGLKATVDPLSDSDDYGIYQRTLDFLNKLDSD